MSPYIPLTHVQDRRNCLWGNTVVPMHLFSAYISYIGVLALVDVDMVFEV